MSQRFKLLDILTAVSVVVLLAGAAWMALWGPSGPLPMHFDVEGRPDRWGGRGEVAGLIAFLALVLAVTAGGLGLHAGRTDDPARSRGLRIGQFITLIVVAGLAPILTAHILTFDAEPAAAGAAASSIWPLGVLGFIALATGALLGRVPPNAVIGVRTPWSLKSRLAWDRSNRLFGRLMFWIGLTALVATPFAPQPLGLWLALGAMAAAAIWSVFESWRVWNTDADRQPF
jgi:uncharacterized membrane protein